MMVGMKSTTIQAAIIETIENLGGYAGFRAINSCLPSDASTVRRNLGILVDDGILICGGAIKRYGQPDQPAWYGIIDETPAPSDDIDLPADFDPLALLLGR